MAFFTFTNTAAGAATFNPLTGWQFEYLPFPALVEIAFNSTITGDTVVVTSGSDSLMEAGSPVPAGGTAGVIPDTDKPLLEDLAAAGDRLKIAFTHSAAGSITGWIRVTQVG